MHSAVTPSSARDQSGFVLLFFTMESSGLDEVEQVDARRIDEPSVSRVVCAILSEVPAGLCGGRRADTGDHDTERNRYGPAWPDACVYVVAGVRLRIHHRSSWPLV